MFACLNSNISVNEALWNYSDKYLPLYCPGASRGSRNKNLPIANGAIGMSARVGTFTCHFWALGDNCSLRGAATDGYWDDFKQACWETCCSGYPLNVTPTPCAHCYVKQCAAGEESLYFWTLFRLCSSFHFLFIAASSCSGYNMLMWRPYFQDRLQMCVQGQMHPCYSMLTGWGHAEHANSPHLDW